MYVDSSDLILEKLTSVKMRKESVKRSGIQIKGFEGWLSGALSSLIGKRIIASFGVYNPILLKGTSYKNWIELNCFFDTGNLKVTRRFATKDDIVVFGADLSGIDGNSFYLYFDDEFIGNVIHSVERPFEARDFIKFFSFSDDDSRRAEAESLLKSRNYDFSFIKKYYDDILEFFMDFIVYRFNSVIQVQNAYQVSYKYGDLFKHIREDGTRGNKLVRGIFESVEKDVQRGITGLKLKSWLFPYIEDRKFLPIAFGLLYESLNVLYTVSARKRSEGGFYVISADEVKDLKDYSKFRNKRVERDLGCVTKDAPNFAKISSAMNYTDILMNEDILISINWGYSLV